MAKEIYPMAKRTPVIGSHKMLVTPLGDDEKQTPKQPSKQSVPTQNQ